MGSWIIFLRVDEPTSVTPEDDGLTEDNVSINPEDEGPIEYNVGL